MHRQNFELPTPEHTVEELSVDGGNIRVRTPEGEISACVGYKAISLHHNGTVVTSFQDNQVVIDWVNEQSQHNAHSLVSVMDTTALGISLTN